jgi:hypothetical protein
MTDNRDLNIRKHAKNSFVYPGCCPGLRLALSDYGHLLAVHQKLTLGEFIALLAQLGEHNKKAALTADHLQRWLVLMELMIDSFVRNGMFVNEFTWNRVHYDFDGCLKLLSQEGVRRALKSVGSKEHACIAAPEKLAA